MSWLGGLISGAFGLAGGLLGNRSERKAQDLQLQGAKNSIQWRVADAEKAGVHPLYAIGAPGIQIAPTQVGSLGNAVSQMGQDLSRAVYSQADAEERAEQRQVALGSQLAQLRIASDDAAARRANAEANLALARERQQLDWLRFDLDKGNSDVINQYYQSMVARMRSAQVGPPSPSVRSRGSVYDYADRSGKAGASIESVPSTVVREGNLGGVEAGTKPGMALYDFGGVKVPMLSSGAAESMDSLGPLAALYNLIGQSGVIGQSIRNKFSGGKSPDPALLPRGYKWQWSIWSQSWRPVKE